MGKVLSDALLLILGHFGLEEKGSGPGEVLHVSGGVGGEAVELSSQAGDGPVFELAQYGEIWIVAGQGGNAGRTLADEEGLGELKDAAIDVLLYNSSGEHGLCVGL